MHKILFGVLCGAMSLAQAASGFVFSNEPGPHGVGLRIVQQYDYSRTYKAKIDLLSGQPSTGERARPLQTLIWYPAAKGGAPVHYMDYFRTVATEEVFQRPAAEIDKIAADRMVAGTTGMSAEAVRREEARPMWAVRDAKPAAGKFPVVIYAPSYNAPAHENVDLCEYLASQGYVVLSTAAIGPHGRNMTTDLEGVEAQAGDIEFLVGYAHTLPQADAAHVGVIGYSWGGLANVLAAARDSRISALVSLDGSVRYFPELVRSAKYVSPERMTAPFMYISARPRSVEEYAARKFDMSSSLLNDVKYADFYKLTMYPMEHPNFSSEFQRFAPDSGRGFTEYTREESSLAMSWMARYVAQFLNAYLKNDTTGLAYLSNAPAKNGVPAHMLLVEKRASLGMPPTIETFAAGLGQRGFNHAGDVYADMQKKHADFKLDEQPLVDWGYRLLQADKVKESIEIFKLATVVAPKSANAFDSLAEAYQKAGDRPLAIKNYQRSLELDPKNTNAVDRLKILQAGASAPKAG
ncbi:MAG TPA: dienelactone hydrolase family protein [Telluria sp.]|nr:dienelactone hydrolase family protein [Telluria sp.]